MAANPSTSSWRNVVAGVVILVVIYSCVESTSKKQRSAPSPPDRFDAIAACKHFVRQALHDPSSVEWVDASSWPSTKDQDYVARWRVTATYRARNGFGALRLSTAKCVLDHERDDRWKLADLAAH